MRLIKMFGLAAIAAVAAMAFAGSASADVLCLESGKHNGKCEAASVYKGDVLGLTNGKTAILLDSSLGTVEECHSTVLGLGPFTDENDHKGLKVLVDVLNFTECNGICGKATGHTPAWLLVQTLSLDAFVEEDGVRPGARLEECPFGITCLYQLTSSKQLLLAESDKIIADHVPLTRVSGAFCPATTFWDATYLVTKDEVNGAPIYAAALD